MVYYVILNGTQQGPFSVDQICALGITAETPVWCEGMADWTPAGQVADFATRLNHGYQQPGQGWQQPNPGYQQPGPGFAPGQNFGGDVPPCPPNYLAWAIIVTILCCLPFGIVAIVKSSEVNNAYAAGDYTRAYNSSQSAKNWCIWGAVCGVVFSVFYVGAMACTGMFAALGSM